MLFKVFSFLKKLNKLSFADYIDASIHLLKQGAPKTKITINVSLPKNDLHLLTRRQGLFCGPQPELSKVLCGAKVQKHLWVASPQCALPTVSRQATVVKFKTCSYLIGFAMLAAELS